MANPLFKAFGNSQPIQNAGSPFDMFGGPQQFQQTLNNYAQNFMSKMTCTPEQKVRELLDSGRMTPEQFNQLSSLANRLTGRN